MGTNYVLEKLLDVSGPGLLEAGRYRGFKYRIHKEGLYVGHITITYTIDVNSK